jgi:hypothetical protein
VLVLVSRNSGVREEDFLDLRGRTSSGFPIKMVVSDGKLGSFDTHISVRCPDGDSHGAIRSRAMWGTGADAIACEGRASFSARERD